MLSIIQKIKDKILDPLISFPSTEVDVEASIHHALNARPPSRRSDWFRIGGINNRYECDRRVVLGNMEKIYTDRMRPDPSRVMMMDLGSAIHEMLQVEHLGPTGKLFGSWKCPTCHQHYSSTYGTYPDEWCSNQMAVIGPDGEKFRVPCSKEQKYRKSRGKAYWLYEEIRLKDKERNLSGRLDGVWIDDGGWYVLEAKSIDTHVYSDRRKTKLKKEQAIALGDLGAREVLTHFTGDLPKDYHVNQAAVYAGLLQDLCLFDMDFTLNLSDFRGVLILYVDRNTLKSKTYVKTAIDAEFREAETTVKRRLEALAAADMEVLDDAEADAARIEKNRKIAFRFNATCTNRNHFKAKECPWRTICFPYKKAEKNGVDFLQPKGD